MPSNVSKWYCPHDLQIPPLSLPVFGTKENKHTCLQARPSEAIISDEYCSLQKYSSHYVVKKTKHLKHHNKIRCLKRT